jgi:hypothetical protein
MNETAKMLRENVATLRRSMSALSERVERTEKKLCPLCWIQPEPGRMGDRECPACGGTGLRRG